jgi:cyclophilin family peptidyl-prolyl cis-trans isomerase
MRVRPIRSSLLFAALLFGLAGCGGSEPGSETTTSAAPPPAATPGGSSGTGASSKEKGKNPPAAGEKKSTAGKPVGVVMETSMGTIDLELYPDKAPATVENFVHYVKKGHYNGTIFHRVISNFMIQGGGFTPDMQQKPTDPPVKNESANGLHNERSTIAMARTSDPDSATAQFFINVEDNTPKLDTPNPPGAGYTVFGKVTRGMDVVDKIKAVPTTRKGPYDDVPETPVVIKSVTLKK